MALLYYRGPIFLADFEIIPTEAVRGQIFLGGRGDGRGGRVARPLLGEGIADRLG